MKHEITTVELSALNTLIEQVVTQAEKLTLDFWALNKVGMLRTRIEKEIAKGEKGSYLYLYEGNGFISDSLDLVAEEIAGTIDANNVDPTMTAEYEEKHRDIAMYKFEGYWKPETYWKPKMGGSK